MEWQPAIIFSYRTVLSMSVSACIECVFSLGPWLCLYLEKSSLPPHTINWSCPACIAVVLCGACPMSTLLKV